MKILFLVILLSISQIQSDSLCEYATEDGQKYSFDKLRRSDKDYEFTHERYTYKANFCGPLVSRCSNGPNVPAAYFLTTNNVCLSKLAFSWHPTITYIDSIIKSMGIKISLPDGEKCYIGKGNHKVTYIMKCDPNEELKFVSADKVNACTVEYHFSTKYGCINSSGLKFSFSFVSDGSLFTPKNILVTLGFILFLYFTLFTYYNYKRNPEDGLIKAMPNRDFWSCLVSSIADGCSITYNFFRSKITGSNNKNYENLV